MDLLFREPPSAHAAGAMGIPGVMGSQCGVALGDALGAGPRAAGCGDSIRIENGEIARCNLSNLKHICHVTYFVNLSQIGAVTAGYHLNVVFTVM